MSVVSNHTPKILSLTQRATDKVKFLIADEGNDNLNLRVFVTGGGCSGFSYGFSFEENISEDDSRIEQDGITVLVDSLSYPYLLSSEIDYHEGLEGSRFVVNNPNATTTCGCGVSFSI